MKTEVVLKYKFINKLDTTCGSLMKTEVVLKWRDTS